MCFPVPNSSVPTEFPITNGNAMNTEIQRYIPAHRMAVGLRAGWWIVTVLVVPLWGGCARLEPIAESAHADVQVVADSLRIAVREAQRTAADLRAELDEQRRDLAEAHVARAQLQGMLRETERRLGDARQIIELQREELASARIERERVAQAVRPLHSRLRQSSLVAPYQGKTYQLGADGVVPASAGLRDKAVVWPLPPEEEPPSPSSHMVIDARPVPEEPVPEESKPVPVFTPETATVVPIRTIVVQNGETLWRLSRRHKVNLEALRLLNGLPNNLIVVGRTLRLPEPR